jgi:hypothetical protein
VADYRDMSVLAGPARGSSILGRTEPDLDLIKQVEQVAISALERPAWRFAAIPSEGTTDAVEVLVFLIWQLLHWLLSGCKNSQERPRATCLRSGSPARLPTPPGGSTEPGLQNSPRLIHNCEKE